jgi:hypothetical protein
MASGWTPDRALPLAVPSPGQDRRREPRVDVMLRIKGEMVRPEAPILIHDLSRSGFAVLSQIAFGSGQPLDFRLTGEDGTTVTVSAHAIHSKPMPASPGLYLSGFMFVPGRLTGLVPQALIDRLIATVAAPDGPCFFERR